MSGEGSALESALAVHRRTAAAFVAALETVPEALWSAPLAPGKWTAAQLGEHILLTYTTTVAALSGGPGMRMVLPWWKTQYLRLTVLRRILGGRGFPAGAPAPRELRPAKHPERDRAQTLCDLREFLVSAERALSAASPETRLPHAYFGRLTCEQLVGVQTAHLDHHRRQLERLQHADA